MQELQHIRQQLALEKPEDIISGEDGHNEVVIDVHAGGGGGTAEKNELWERKKVIQKLFSIEFTMCDRNDKNLSSENGCLDRSTTF